MANIFSGLFTGEKYEPKNKKKKKNIFSDVIFSNTKEEKREEIYSKKAESKFPEQMTPMKTIRAFGGESRAESYYGKEGVVTPRVSIDYDKISKRDDTKRFDILGTLKTEIDHIQSKALGGTDSPVNLKSEDAQRTWLDIIKRTPSNELKDYQRQGGKLAAEKTIIQMYQDDKISQIQALEAMGKLKETEVNLVGGSSVLTAMKMAWNKLTGKEPTSGIIIKKKQPVKGINITIPTTPEIGKVIDKPETSNTNISVQPTMKTPSIKITQPKIQEQIRQVKPVVDNNVISNVIGAKPTPFRASVGQSILKAATSAMVIQPFKTLAGLAKMGTEQQTEIVNKGNYPKFIKDFTSKTNDKINKTFDKWIDTIDEENRALMYGVYKDDGKYDAQEVASLITQGVSSLAIAYATGGLSGGTTLPSILFGAIQTSDTYLEARESGMDTDEATLSAVADGTWTAITEKIGLDFMFGKYFKGSGLLKRMATTLVTETSQELLQQYGSNAIATIGYDKGRNIFEGTLDTIIATLPTALIGGGMAEIARTQQVKQIKNEFKNNNVTLSNEEAGTIYDKLVDSIVEQRDTFEQDILKEIQIKQAKQVKPVEQKITEVKGLPVQEVKISELQLEPMDRKLAEQDFKAGKKSQTDLPVLAERNVEGKLQVIDGNARILQAEADGKDSIQVTTDKELYLQKARELETTPSQKPKTADTEILDKKMTYTTSLIEQARKYKNSNEYVDSVKQSINKILPDDFDVKDINIVGSVSRGKTNPNDIDVAVDIINKKTGKAVKNFLDLDTTGTKNAPELLKINNEIENILSEKLTGGKLPAENLMYGVQKDRPFMKLEQIYKEANKPVKKVTKELTYKPVEEVKKVSPTIKETKVGKSIAARGIEKGILSGIEEVAEYNATTLKEQEAIFNRFIREYPLDDVFKVIKGNMPLPEGMKGAELIVGISNIVERSKSIDITTKAKLLMELSKSPYASESSVAGQTMRIIRERKKDSAAVRIYRLKKMRDARAKRRLKDRGKSDTKVKENIKKSVKKAISKEKITKSEWDNFINEIKC